jgi:hypothetical protein
LSEGLGNAAFAAAKNGLLKVPPWLRALLLDERYRPELKFYCLRTSGKRGVGIACRPWISWVRQGYVRNVLSRVLALKQPLTKTLELAETMLTREQDTITIESLRPAEGQRDRACPPRLDAVEQRRRGSACYLVFSAESDVRGNE